MRLKIFLFHLIYVSVIAAYAFIIGCPLKQITGLDCPFCGMTRAYLAFFSGDFKLALQYHELFYLGIPCMLGLTHLRILKKRRGVFIAVTIFCIGCTIAFITRFVLIAIQEN